jgi:hypothetical protein
MIWTSVMAVGMGERGCPRTYFGGIYGILDG